MVAVRKFRPGLWPTLATLVLVPLFIRLGFWQLERAEEKRQIVQLYEANLTKPPLQLETAAVGPGDQYRRVEVSGKWDTAHQILWDNRIYQGRPGYYVLTPLRIAHSDQWVLVNRGWVAMGATREQLPDIRLGVSGQLVHGLLKTPLEGEFTAGVGNIWTDRWPQVMEWLDLGQAAQALQRPLVPYVVLQSAEDAGPFVREWSLLAAPPEKSTSYAWQWFAFAAIVLGLYLFLNYKKSQPGEGSHG